MNSKLSAYKVHVDKTVTQAGVVVVRATSKKEAEKQAVAHPETVNWRGTERTAYKVVRGLTSAVQLGIV